MKKAPAPEELARVVRWALLLFFAYALYSGALNFGQSSSPPPRSPAAVAAANGEPPKDKDCEKSNPLRNFSRVMTSLIPATYPVVRHEDIKTGTGTVAACGQKATLRYQYTVGEGTEVFSNLKSSETTEAVIGKGTLLHGMELGMLGMQPGGERTMMFPAVFAFGPFKDISGLQDSDKFKLKLSDLRSSVVTGHVVLQSLSPEIPDSQQPLRVIDQQIGGIVHAQCGDAVRVSMTVWKLDGTKVFSTEGGAPLIFRLGESELPYGLEAGVMGMTENGLRTIIVPPAYAKPLLASGESADAPGLTLPQETVVAEVRLEHLGTEPLPPRPAPKPAEEKKAPDAPQESGKPEQSH